MFNYLKHFERNLAVSLSNKEMRALSELSEYILFIKTETNQSITQSRTRRFILHLTLHTDSLQKGAKANSGGRKKAQLTCFLPRSPKSPKNRFWATVSLFGGASAISGAPRDRTSINRWAAALRPRPGLVLQPRPGAPPGTGCRQQPFPGA